MAGPGLAWLRVRSACTRNCYQGRCCDCSRGSPALSDAPLPVHIPWRLRLATAFVLAVVLGFTAWLATQ